MIRGTVIAGRGPVVPLQIRGPDGSDLDVNAFVDTGFTAAMTLPQTLIDALSLRFDSKSELELADATIRQFDLFVAEVHWDGTWTAVLASALGDDVLIGMRMLSGHRLTIDAVPGGDVEITKLP